MIAARRLGPDRGARRSFALATAIGLVAAGMALLPAGPAAGADTLPPGFAIVDEASMTGSPLEVAYVPDGRRFVAEKSGRVRVVRPDGTIGSVLDIRAKVNSYSDRGLLGLAADKDFASNGWLYLLFSQELDPAAPDGAGPMTSALTRITVRADSTAVDGLTSIGTYVLGSQGSQPCPTPADTLDCMPSDHYWHSIGTVRVDPVDGTLWVGSGDAHVTRADSTSYRTFDPTNTVGKILHVDRNGRGLAGHPFCPEVTDLSRTCTKVYASGFRNPFRFVVRAGKGPVVGDVGAEEFEEVNLVRPGRNYGWPCYEGAERRALHASTSTCQALYAREGTADAATPPAWAYPHGDGASVIVGPVYDGTSYPADMRGDVFVGDYVQGWVKRLDLDAQDRVTGVSDFDTAWTGVSLHRTPGGDIGYVDLGYASGNAGLRQYRFSGATGTAPRAVAAATPSTGPAPLTVQLSSAGSEDPDGGALTYDWDFGDGSARSTLASPSHVYGADGRYTATLRVQDPSGAQGTATVSVVVGSGSAPKPVITSPASGSQYSDGSRVTVGGSASDAEDGPLPGTSLSWQVLLRHGTHLHELTTFTGSSGSFVPVTDHDADSAYEIRLTAVDSSGASTTVTRTISPRTVSLTLQSSPPGVPLAYEGVAAAAPSTRTAAVGYKATVEAPAQHVLGGRTYAFAGWSDGGAARNAISVPSVSTTLTAYYSDVAPVSLVPTADTHVSAQAPDTAYGSRSSLAVDGSPEQQALLRFSVDGVGQRTIARAVLRVHEVGDSVSGGRVRLVAGGWSEAATTWTTRPALGAVVGTLPGRVAAGTWYDVELSPGDVPRSGSFDLALDSLSSDGHAVASRTSAQPPQLVLTLNDAPPPPRTVALTATADTYVSAASPAKAYGSSSTVRADADPQTLGLLRFQVSGTAGRAVTGAVLRVHELDASASGGRVRAVTGGWDEATTTWDTRPALGDVVAVVDRPVTSGTWYDVPLPTSVVKGDGTLDLALDSLSSDGRVIASRGTATPPQLLLTTQTSVVLPATADTYVASAAPSTAHGSRSTLRVDADPATWSLTRFDTSSLQGRAVQRVVLRVFATDASAVAGRVRRVTGSWTEAATTWSTRPALGAVLGTGTGPVAAGSWYEVVLPPDSLGTSGVLDLALDTSSTDGHAVAARTSQTPPQLVVAVS